MDSRQIIHLNPGQILKAIANAQAGVNAGHERPSDVKGLNRLAERCFAASLVLLFHSVPGWVAGDWLVEQDGSSMNWHFMGSRFVAAIDESFDYKHERKERLDDIRLARVASISF